MCSTMAGLLLFTAIHGVVAPQTAATSPAVGLITPSNGERNGPETCSKWFTGPQEQGHEPWSHAPFCIPNTNTAGGKGKKKQKPKQLCVFTNVSFDGGRGISIVASPDVAGKMVRQNLLTVSREPVSQLVGGGGAGGPAVKYEEIEKPGLGIGLFVRASSQGYKAGEIIMWEYPTLIVPSGGADSAVSNDVLDMLRWKALLQLPKPTRIRTRALAQSKRLGKDEIIDILDTNAFTHEKGGRLHDVIFPEAARMNHNCIPNAVTRTNESTLAMEVIALRDIHPGEEIAHSYLDPSVELTSYERGARLQSGWGFQCQCPLCSGNRGRLEESDRRRRDISNTKASLETAAGGDPGRILMYAETLLSLYAAEGMILPRADFYALAAHACMYLGERKRALEFSEKARRLWDVIFGTGSRESEEMRQFQRKLGKV